MTLDSQIEAILFFRGEPVSLKKLAEILEAREETVAEAIGVLKEKLAGRGVTLVEKDGEVMLGTAGEASELIEKIRKEELSRDLGKAGLETLAIVLYRGPVSRPDIDYIRGVNSSFILRNLLVRGLVERASNPDDSRSFLYKPTFELMSLLGLSALEELPEFETMKEKVEEFVKEKEESSDEAENKQ